jgi:Common central domain of tyrosinase/Polyphenol oxidase middle domain
MIGTAQSRFAKLDPETMTAQTLAAFVRTAAALAEAGLNGQVLALGVQELLAAASGAGRPELPAVARPWRGGGGCGSLREAGRSYAGDSLVRRQNQSSLVGRSHDAQLSRLAMGDPQTRRAFLASAGITVAALSQRAAAQPNRPAEPKPDLPPMRLNILGVRQNVADMADDHPVLKSYRKAVLAMQKLDASDPLSWWFQANMHGTLGGDGQNADWTWCMHGNWWFLPWHRGYLYFFEQIVRKVSGDDTFRLPYWAWDQPGQNVLPAPFLAARYEGAGNPLFDATRKRANEGNPLRPSGSAGSFHADWVAARGTDRFAGSIASRTFGGIRKPKTNLPAKPERTEDHGVMESRAHDLIHDSVGAGGGNMRNTKTAARDPIFWLHHANVDRLWNRWLDDRGHENPMDQDWYDQQFPFYDQTGTRVVLSVGEILEHASRTYRYDEERRQFMAAVGPLVQGGRPMEPTIVGVASVQSMLKLGTTPFMKPLPFAAESKPRLMAALAAAPVRDTEPPAVVLQVEGIKPPKAADLMYEVFVTRVGEKPSPKTYVGPITFFGRGEDGHGRDEGGFTQGFDVTDVLQKLRRANDNALPDLEVSIVPHSTAGMSDADLAKEKIDVPISNATLKLITEDKK